MHTPVAVVDSLRAYAIRPYSAGDRQILESRSQTMTLKFQRGKNLKYLSYVFTEQGVAMLSAVLRSKP